ncbi:F-box domain-containing protein [Coprinopsis cinerea AmutBmut pab1-1]|nr:F-box domain-containing protein [Coprinopsis cinerea AmutBmut pab1-1]
MPSHDAPFTSGEQAERSNSPNYSDKGKGVSMPMPIRTSTIIHDLFDVSLSNTSPSQAPSSFSPSDFSSFSPSSFAFSFPSSSSSSYKTSLASPISDLFGEGRSFDNDGETRSGKGKGREMPPVLPPLTFCPTEMGEGNPPWVTFEDPNPSSSFNSPVGSSIAAESSSVRPSPPIVNFNVADGIASSASSSEDLFHAPLRCNMNAASDFIVEQARPSHPHRPQSYLARKLAFGRNSTPTPSRPTSPPSGVGVAPPESRGDDTIVLGGNGRGLWYTAPKVDESPTIVSRPPPPIPPLPLVVTPSRPTSPRLLKHKGRSQSEPLPFSVLDYVPISCTDLFEPLPLFIKNYFGDILPREIHLHILRSFVEIYIDDHRRAVESGRWSVYRASASRNQWVGRDKGVRELVKLSRVSKSWRTAVYDGQLWIDLDLHGLPRLPQHVTQRIAQTGGPFIQRLNLAGHAHIEPEHLIDITDSLCLTVPYDSSAYTQLTSINLQGCTNLTTQSLHRLLIRSRNLETLILKGLGCVTNTTCEILAAYCPRLTSLNLSRCPNMDASGIGFMAKSALARQQHLQLKELRLSGLKYTTESMMQALGCATPLLEVLDLSYARQLRNAALEAFVACDDDDDEMESDTVVVSARDLGRDTGSDTGPGRYRRRITRLRHLNLSFCPLLTDTACANLSHSIPRLEFLELAGIGSDMREAGLIRLLERTPFIKRLDLEDASDLTDTFLAAITPVPDKPTSTSTSPTSTPTEDDPQPGYVLQQLIVSYASQLSDDALLNLIRNCPQLTVLEVDNTRIGSAVFREFVRLSKERQLKNAKIAAVDCRGIGESVVKELTGSTRPRRGWRAYAARKLCYLDGRDGNEEDLKIGQDECDEGRVVVKTFYSWQTVDAVKANREKRRKANSRRAVSTSSGREDEDGGGGSGGRTRWWSPGGRRSGRTSPPVMTDIPNEGCRTM